MRPRPTTPSPWAVAASHARGVQHRVARCRAVGWVISSAVPGAAAPCIARWPGHPRHEVLGCCWAVTQMGGAACKQCSARHCWATPHDPCDVLVGLGARGARGIAVRCCHSWAVNRSRACWAWGTTRHAPQRRADECLAVAASIAARSYAVLARHGSRLRMAPADPPCPSSWVGSQATIRGRT